MKALATRVCQQLFREANKPPPIFKSTLFHLKAREHLRDRAKYGTQYAMIPTSGDRALRLPASPSVPYYILRLMRLTGKYGLSLLRRVL
jgi:hypothetical protein